MSSFSPGRCSFAPKAYPCRRFRTAGGAFVALLAVSVGWASRAEAQVQPQGFAVERLYPSAPGGGWVVMDALDMRGGLGGGVALSVGYAHDPLQVRSADGSQHLTVVADQAFAAVGFAVTYDRFRLYLNLDAPLAISGQSGIVGNDQFTAPSLDPGSHPDTLPDARFGFDARLLGGPKSPFRLGAGAQLMVPSGNVADYDTDGTYRAMGRVLFAGDVGLFTYAGQLGVHIRPRDDSPAPGSPQGSELLFGVAAGIKAPITSGSTTALIVGPEIYGATAFESFLGSTGTALEGLMSGRIEGTSDDGPQLRVKLGTGVGLNPHFGAPEWRLVFAIEVFDHHSDRDNDGVSDSKDACPDTPGVKAADPKTNGCPPAPDQGAVAPGEGTPPDAAPKPVDPGTQGSPPPRNDESHQPLSSAP
jgi:OOP family OmpA-OmpF porin